MVRYTAFNILPLSADILSQVGILYTWGRSPVSSSSPWWWRSPPMPVRVISLSVSPNGAR